MYFMYVYPFVCICMYLPWFLWLQPLLWFLAHPSALHRPTGLGRPGTAQHRTSWSEHLHSFTYIHNGFDHLLFWTLCLLRQPVFYLLSWHSSDATFTLKRHRLIGTNSFINLYNYVTFPATANERKGTSSSPSLPWVLCVPSHLYHPGW